MRQLYAAMKPHQRYLSARLSSMPGVARHYLMDDGEAASACPSVNQKYKQRRRHHDYARDQTSGISERRLQASIIVSATDGKADSRLALRKQ